MTALTQRSNPRISGAVMAGGKMLCFDVNDVDLEVGARAVVINAKDQICVDTIVERPTGSRSRRGGLIGYISGCHAPGVKERLHVKVLGRYIPHKTAPERASREHQKERTLEGAL